MVKKYYFVPKIGSDNKTHKLLKPFRIVRLPDSFPFKPSRGYGTIRELRRNDTEWKKYYEADPKSAIKITESKFVLDAEYFVFLPMDDESFNRVSYKLLKHTVMGELSNKVMGIHMISRMNPNIISVTQKALEDKVGVWKADIEYYSVERDKKYIKKDSTMFPKYWDPTTFMFKIYEAYKAKVQCDFDENTFHSYTSCGVPVDFIIRNGDLKTVYPKYQEN